MTGFDWEAMGLLAQLAGASAEGKPRCRFHGTEYVLIGSVERGGALATPEQFEHGECSFAHLFADGRILRFGEQIGNVHELEWLAPAAGEHKEEGSDSAAGTPSPEAPSDG